MATHSSTLAWQIPWTEEPGRLQSMGSRRVGHDWATSLSRIGEGNGNPLQWSCLENPRDGGACWAAIYRVAQSWTRLKRLSSSSSKLLNIESSHCKQLFVATYKSQINLRIYLFFLNEENWFRKLLWDLLLNGPCCCSVTKSCPSLGDPVNCSMPGFHVPHRPPRVCPNSCPSN